MTKRAPLLAILAIAAACSGEPTRLTAPPVQGPSATGATRDVIPGSNLVVNGSFEQPPTIPFVVPWLTYSAGSTSLPGWTIESGSVDVQDGEPTFAFTGVPDGSQVLDMNTATISQAVATQAGVTYQVSFELSENYTILNGGSVSIEADFGGVSQTFTFSDPSGSATHMSWDKEVFDVTATGASTTLRFKVTGGANSAGGPMIDAVQVQSPSTYTSGSNVMTWDPIFPASADPTWPTTSCTTVPAVGVNANWQNPHNAFVLTGHPWAYSYFFAPWINAWNALPSEGPGGQSYTKYSTPISGTGNYVVQLLADNCSWIYIDSTLVGVQNTDLSKNTYPVTLSGNHTLTFIIFDGGGSAGGKFLLQTYQSYVANGGDPGVIQAPPVVNSPPTVAANGNATANEGSTATNAGTVSDPDHDAVTLTASVGTITNNGNGTWSWSYATTDGPAQSQDVTVTANDGNGHQVQTSFHLTVNNVAPTVNAGAGATIESGSAFTLDGSFTDPGADAPWTSTIDWGDGSTGAGLTGSHTYLVPGTYTVTLTVRDKDGASGSATAQVVVTEKHVLIDIKPGSDVNPINLGSGGVTPVGVLSVNGFDATTIDASTVRFGPAAIAAGAHHTHLEDVNGDGVTDFLGQFDTDALGLTASDTKACLTGRTVTGVYIKGCDSITVVPPKGSGKNK